MTKWIRATVFLVAFMLVRSAAIDAASAMPLQAGVETQQAWTAADLSARRRVRHHTRYVQQPHDRSYYDDRPYYYAPAPFVPFSYGYLFWPRL